MDDPSDTQVHDLFADLSGNVPFAIVERATQHYFQIHIDLSAADGVEYDVEFRDGGPDRHFHARVAGGHEFDRLDRVMAAYRSWRDGSPGVLAWERLAL